jgi:hypothetical protein
MDSQDTLQYQINIPERMMIFIDARNIYEAEKEYNLRAEQHFVFGYHKNPLRASYSALKP